MFASRFVPGKTVLDAGCGAGYGSKILSQAGAIRVDAVDIREDLIKHARQNYGASNINFTAGDIRAYRSDAPYDVIVCFETIEHIKEYDRVLSALYTLLRRGGELLISSPNRLIASPSAMSIDDAPDNKFHIREFTVNELRAALENHGFEVRDPDIFGQRQQLYSKNVFLQKVYRRLMNPDENSSPAVTRVNDLTPRYFIIIAKRPPGDDTVSR